MTTEQAPVAATPVDAAPSVDAGNVSAQDSNASEMAALLDQMSLPPETVAAEDGEAAGEPADAAAGGDGGAVPVSSPEAEPEEPAEDSADASTDADAGPGRDPDDEKRNPNARNFRGRWDHLNEEERRVVELTTKRGLSLGEAYRAVYGDAKPGARQEPPAADPVAAVDAEIQDAESAIAGLDKQIATAGLDAKAQGALRKDLAAAARRLGRLEAKKDEAVRDQESQAQAQARAVCQQAQARAFEAYPQAFAGEPVAAGQFSLNTESELGQAVGDELQYLEATASPLLQNPNCLPILVSRVARQLGLRPAVKAAGSGKPEGASPLAETATAKATAAAAPKRTARPVATGGSAPLNPSFDQQARQALASNSLDTLLAAMREGGTQFADLIQ